MAAGVLSADVMADGHVKDRLALCDARTGKILRRWSDSGKNGSDLEQVLFSDDGRLLATSDGSAVHVWEAATTTKVLTLEGHRDEIRTLALSAGGWRLASASRDSTALVWDLALALGTSSATPTACWNDLGSPNARRTYRRDCSTCRHSRGRGAFPRAATQAGIGGRSAANAYLDHRAWQ